MVIMIVVGWMVTDRMVATVIMFVIMMVIDWMVIRFCNAFYIYMKRIIHQRNSFNHFHRMIGGLENNYWEQRRREWEAWKAEEKKWKDSREKQQTGMNGTMSIGGIGN